MTIPVPPERSDEATPLDPEVAGADGAVTTGSVPGGLPAEALGGTQAAGLRALSGEEFSYTAAVGGWRGLAESVAPGLVFLVVFLITQEMVPPVIAALGVALVLVVARLLRRSPVTYALGGVLGVAIGAFAAWRSGGAENFYVWGLVTNAAFAIVCLVTLAVRRPLVGLVVSALGLDPSLDKPGENEKVLDLGWRADPDAMRRYTAATWLWCAAFAVRLAVQVPLWLQASVGWLGTARLVMGLPLWALVLWLTWVLVRPAVAAGRSRAAARPV